MSHAHEHATPTDVPPDAGDQALSVLRDIWTARAQTSLDIDEGTGKVCKATAKLGFHVGDDEEGQEIRDAWKAQLEREGKLSPEGTSIRELVLGSAEHQQ